jgi:hypothetical protein
VCDSCWNRHLGKAFQHELGATYTATGSVFKEIYANTIRNELYKKARGGDLVAQKTILKELPDWGTHYNLNPVDRSGPTEETLNYLRKQARE